MKFKTSFALCFFLLGSLLIASCKKKEKPQETESSEEARAVIPEPAPTPPESDSFEDQMADEPVAQTPETSTAPEESKEVGVASKPKPHVDPNIIRQRLKTYRTDLSSQEVRVKKFEEMQNKFNGDDEEFDQKFQEALASYREERSNFDKLLKSLRKNPSLLQWESKEREWADEWRHVLRSFNDLEALYEKQYEGLK